jgi:hypothetical protein
VSRLTKFLLVLTAMVTFGVMAQAASATSGAHFFSASATVSSSSSTLGDLVGSWDEAGVGQETVDYSLTANGTALYACINGGGNHPKASNKQEAHGPVGANGSFAPTKNGRIIGSLSAAPPASTLVCPSGQTFVLACVKYTDIFLTDTTNGVMTGDLGPVSATFVNITGCPIP